MKREARELSRSGKNGFGAVNIDGPGLFGINRTGWFPDDRRKMDHRIAAIQGGGDGASIADVTALELEVRMTLEREQGFAAIDQLVKHGHPKTGLQQVRGHARSEIARATSHKNMHIRPTFCTRFV